MFRKSFKFMGAFFMGAFIVLIAVGIGAVFYFTGDMVHVADKFFNAIRENDLDQAFATYYEAGVDQNAPQSLTLRFSSELQIDEQDGPATTRI